MLIVRRSLRQVNSCSSKNNGEHCHESVFNGIRFENAVQLSNGLVGMDLLS